MLVFEQLRAQLNGWLSFVFFEKQLCCNLFWFYIFKLIKTLVLKRDKMVMGYTCVCKHAAVFEISVCVLFVGHLKFLRNCLKLLSCLAPVIDQNTNRTKGRGETRMEESVGQPL